MEVNGRFNTQATNTGTATFSDVGYVQEFVNGHEHYPLAAIFKDDAGNEVGRLTEKEMDRWINWIEGGRKGKCPRPAYMDRHVDISEDELLNGRDAVIDYQQRRIQQEQRLESGRSPG